MLVQADKSKLPFLLILGKAKVISYFSVSSSSSLRNDPVLWILVGCYMGNAEITVLPQNCVAVLKPIHKQAVARCQKCILRKSFCGEWSLCWWGVLVSMQVGKNCLCLGENHCLEWVFWYSALLFKSLIINIWSSPVVSASNLSFCPIRGCEKCTYVSSFRLWIKPTDLLDLPIKQKFLLAIYFCTGRKVFFNFFFFLHSSK